MKVIIRMNKVMTQEEKLTKIRQLADAMYYSMQNLTTDTTKIRKAMQNYRNFVINELSENRIKED